MIIQKVEKENKEKSINYWHKRGWKSKKNLIIRHPTYFLQHYGQNQEIKKNYGRILASEQNEMNGEDFSYLLNEQAENLRAGWENKSKNK